MANDLTRRGSGHIPTEARHTPAVEEHGISSQCGEARGAQGEGPAIFSEEARALGETQGLW